MTVSADEREQQLRDAVMEAAAIYGGWGDEKRRQTTAALDAYVEFVRGAHRLVTLREVLDELGGCQCIWRDGNRTILHRECAPHFEIGLSQAALDALLMEGDR